MFFPRLLGILLTGLGNRCWGSGAIPVVGHVLGALLMGLGMWTGRHDPLLALLVYSAAAFVFRVWSSAPWLKEEQHIGPWEAGLWRSLLVLIIALARLWYDHDPLVILRAILAAGMIPAFYRWSPAAVTVLSRFTTTPVDPTALAELLTGIAVGFI